MPQYPENIESMIDEGYNLQKAGKLREAEHMYKQVLALDPENAEAMQLWGHIAEATNNHHAAAELMRRSLSLEPSQAEVWVSYAKMLMEIREDALSVQALEAAVQVRPDYDHAYFNLGVAMISAGKPEEAPKYLQKAISLAPDSAESYRVLATLGEIKPESESVDKIKALLENEQLDMEKRLNLHYALAMVYYKTKNKKDFAHHLFEANRLQSAYTLQDQDISINQHATISANFTPENMKKAAQAKPPSYTPIFIVGVPRSGTTLVERILSAHPMVEAGEELQYLRDPTLQNFMTLTGKPFPEGFQDLSQDQLNAVASGYTERTQRLFPNAKFITDKNPGNFYATGMINLLFPNAKIIALHRDPMDTCFSVLRNTFPENMPYCCDLNLMADFYRDYNNQIKHWQNLIPGFVFEIRYEDIIKEQEIQTRQLLDFCGLDWNDACLEFFQNETAVRTLSASQVRQPVYKSSIGGWKKYRKELGPLAEALGDLVVD